MHRCTLHLLYLLLILISYNSFGQIEVGKNDNLFYIGEGIQILESDTLYSIDEIIDNTIFKKSYQDVPNIGLSKKSIWIKFTLLNRGIDPNFLINLAYPILDSIEFFEYQKGKGVLKKQKTGEAYPFLQRSFRNPNYVFAITIAKNEKKDYYLKIYSNEPIILPITVGKANKVWFELVKENVIIGVFLGIILIMAFYNLFIYFSTKDKGYLYYVFYVIFVGLTQLGIKGFNYQFLWPNAPHFQSKSILIFACLASISALLFANYYLQLKNTAPKWRYVIFSLIAFFIASLIVGVWVDSQLGFQLMLQSTSISSIAVIIVSLYVMLKGFKPAIYFFIAWSVLLVGSIIFLLKDFGILPYNIFTSNCIQAASAIEMALLSFGLANRINILKKEKELSQMATLVAAQENQKIISEQNVMLEQKVAARTYELKETNEDLKSTLENLKQTQSQLVEAEKMASLGQLTAGIAHEINNPINFVTGNINPLKRDVAMIFEAIEFVETVGLLSINEAEKKQKIEEYKEELDYEYLKEEINHLLDGIYEGSSRTAEIVKGLRIFSRIDESDLKHADINEGLNSTLIIINNLLSGTIQIDKKYDTNLPPIECFPGKLNQVFLNILSNSIHAIRSKFGDKKGGEISISTNTEQGEIIIKISDNGIGMSAETIHKVFEPFFTTKEVGVGTGLGMSIVYNTIKKHNGIIEIQSELGIGSTLIIKLPKVFIPEIEV